MVLLCLNEMESFPLPAFPKILAEDPRVPAWATPMYAFTYDCVVGLLSSEML